MTQKSLYLSPFYLSMFFCFDSFHLTALMLLWLILDAVLKICRFFSKLLLLKHRSDMRPDRFFYLPLNPGCDVHGL